MKTQLLTNSFRACLRRLGHIVFAAFLLALPAFGQGTAFTYQGRLDHNGSPTSGSYDLRFAIYDAATSGAQQGGTLTNAATAVTNSLFTVTLDFGNQFPGADRWLEIGVRTNGGGAFSTLNPRQRLTPTPYAVQAANATTAIAVPASGIGAGTANINITGNAATATTAAYAGLAASAASVPAANLTGTIGMAQLPASLVTNGASGVTLSGSFTGNGSGLTNVNAATLNGVSGTSFWRTNGNIGANPTNGAFLGTADNLPLEIKVNNQRAMRLEPTATAGSVNVIGGSMHNSISGGAEAATIAGGGIESYPNTITAGFATIGGGTFNTASGGWATIAGGRDNTAAGQHSTVAGGFANLILSNAVNSTIGGGNGNQIGSGAFSSTIGGGSYNYIPPNSISATIPGGSYNTATNFAFAAGYGAQANHYGAFVWADSTPALFPSTANNQYLIRASGGVGININNPQSALHVNGTITAGGYAGEVLSIQPVADLANGPTSNSRGGSSANVISNGVVGGFIGGGGNANFPNRVGGNYASVVGGSGNLASGHNSTAMGERTTAFSRAATAMGWETVATNEAATALGYQTTASGVASTAMGVATKAVGEASTAIGNLTTANGFRSTAMGEATTASGQVSTAMGSQTSASGGGATAMGNLTAASGTVSTAMGYQTTASAHSSTAMGYQTTAGGQFSTALGRFTQANNDDATAMGLGSIASGWDSVAMGTYTVAGGHYSTAAGYYSQANHQGSFVWADSSAAGGFASSGNNQFLVRATGGVGINTSNPNGAALAVNGTATVTSLTVANNIRVPGAGIGTSTPAFVHRVTAGNIEAGNTHRTTITHPLCDGDPNAILIITHNYNPGNTGGTLDTNPTSVYYNASLAKWQIYHDNLGAAPMTVGNAWNVLVIKP